jgi:hypothetical protein
MTIEVGAHGSGDHMPAVVWLFFGAPDVVFGEADR